MKYLRTIGVVVGVLVVFGMGRTANATDLSQAEDTVNRLREPDLPQESTSTVKESPVGQPVSDYKPTGPSVNASEPPSPVDRNNPTGDPDVQAGYDTHQKWHYSK